MRVALWVIKSAIHPTSHLQLALRNSDSLHGYTKDALQDDPKATVSSRPPARGSTCSRGQSLSVTSLRLVIHSLATSISPTLGDNNDFGGNNARSLRSWIEQLQAPGNRITTRAIARFPASSRRRTLGTTQDEEEIAKANTGWAERAEAFLAISPIAVSATTPSPRALEASAH